MESMEGTAGLISCNEEQSRPFGDNNMTVDDTYKIIIPLTYLMSFDSTLVATKDLCCLIYYAVVGLVAVQ